MRIVKSGTKYDVYHDNSLLVYEELPATFFNVKFHQQKGFWLEERNPFTIDEKMYGSHAKKAEKVMRTFNIFERNLGVILSGNKGIGKSLTAKRICLNAIEEKIPVIIVDSYIPGIGSFLSEIEQKVVVLFDEFDKTFAETRDGENSPQTEMLSLFDGLDSGKKLFIVTCNRHENLNEFIVNRPGRFHYHFRFEYPSSEEVLEYLQDNLKEEYYNQIPSVSKFANTINLNYDCLRAIAFEINTGAKFEECVKDLNILNLGYQKYDFKLMFTDGTSVSTAANMRPYESDKYTIEFQDKRGRYILDINFNTADIRYESGKDAYLLPEQFEVIWYWGDYHDCDDESEPEESKILKTKTIDRLVITRAKEKGLHYNLA